MFQLPPDKWRCDRCTLHNQISSTRCEACDKEKHSTSASNSIVTPNATNFVQTKDQATKFAFGHNISNYDINTTSTSDSKFVQHMYKYTEHDFKLDSDSIPNNNKDMNSGFIGNTNNNSNNCSATNQLESENSNINNKQLTYDVVIACDGECFDEKCNSNFPKLLKKIQNYSVNFVLYVYPIVAFVCDILYIYKFV